VRPVSSGYELAPPDGSPVCFEVARGAEVQLKELIWDETARAFT